MAPTLALLIKGLSAGTFGLRFFQIILGTLSVGLLGLAGRHVFNRQVGVIAAIMYALYPPAIYYDGIIQKTALASFLLCLLLAECAYLNRRASKAHSFFAGITLGLLVLTRENALELLSPMDVSFICPKQAALSFRKHSGRSRVTGPRSGNADQPVICSKIFRCSINAATLSVGLVRASSNIQPL